MDRINELSSASVPFEFDVHAFFSENAFELESKLHNHFKNIKLIKLMEEKNSLKLILMKLRIKFYQNTIIQFNLQTNQKLYNTEKL